MLTDEAALVRRIIEQGEPDAVIIDRHADVLDVTCANGVHVLVTVVPQP